MEPIDTLIRDLKVNAEGFTVRKESDHSCTAAGPDNDQFLITLPVTHEQTGMIKVQYRDALGNTVPEASDVYVLYSLAELVEHMENSI